MYGIYINERLGMKGKVQYILVQEELDHVSQPYGFPDVFGLAGQAWSRDPVPLGFPWLLQLVVLAVAGLGCPTKHSWKIS